MKKKKKNIKNIGNIMDKVKAKTRYQFTKEINEDIISWLKRNVNSSDVKSVIHDEEFLRWYFDLSNFRRKENG